jgi:hypothetical protein
VVKANGFSAVAHGAAIGADGALHYLSLLGRRPSVEAIAATLLTGRAATVYPDPLRVGCDVHTPQAWGYRQLRRRLPDGTAHLVLLPARADVTRAQEDAFTIIAPPLAAAEATARLHYLFLARCGGTPLHPSWQGWLWTRARRRDEASPLRCHGAVTAAWACRPDEASLRADLRQALLGAPTYGCLPRPAEAASGQAGEEAA